MRRLGVVMVAVLGALSCILCAAHTTAESQTPASVKKAPKKSSSKSSTKKKPATSSTTARRDKSTTNPLPARPGARESRTEELRGVWIPTDSPRDWDALMKKLKDHGLNAAFVRVAQGGKAIYPSEIVPQDQWAADTGEDELAKAIEGATRMVQRTNAVQHQKTLLLAIY